jgi:hypothetical protein
MVNLASIYPNLATMDGGGLAGGASDGDKEDSTRHYSGLTSIHSLGLASTIDVEISVNRGNDLESL